MKKILLLVVFVGLGSEIYASVLFADAFGWLMLFGEIILSAWLGFRVLKFSGAATLASGINDVRQNAGRTDQVRSKIFGGIAGVIAGILMIVPGVFTDTLGIMFLLWALAKKRSAQNEPDSTSDMHAPNRTQEQQDENQTIIIDADYTRKD